MGAKKIGTLTFSYSSNPGSVLQAYALQQILSEKFSCDVHIINYQKRQAGKPIIGQTVFCGPLRNWTPRNIVKWIARILEHPFRMKKYEKFFKKYYNGYPTKRCLKSDLPLLDDKYDKFIVGSDQVWNFGSWNVDTTYLLDFVTDGSKKISYAASFGNFDIPEEHRETAKELIADFSDISVREAYGVETVSKLTGKSASLVLDPSLLLEKEQYLSLSVNPKKEKYLLLYLREDSPELEKEAKEFASCYGLTVIKILKHWKCTKNGKPLVALGPQEWLGYINNAEYVITNSFHGICFSIIFEKQFYVDLLKKVSVSTNPRIENILSLFNLESRSIKRTNDFSDLETIDYVEVNRIKESLKKESFEYLKKAIERN